MSNAAQVVKMKALFNRCKTAKPVPFRRCILKKWSILRIRYHPLRPFNDSHDNGNWVSSFSVAIL